MIQSVHMCTGYTVQTLTIREACNVATPVFRPVCRSLVAGVSP